MKSIGVADRRKWWLKCTEVNCSPSKCPGKDFNESDNCFNEIFTILSVEGKEPGMPVSVGDIVILSAVGNATASKTRVMNCTYTDSNSSCNLVIVALPSGANLSFPLVQRFRLQVKGQKNGRWIIDKEIILLGDVKQTGLYLQCKKSRRKGHACYLNHPVNSKFCDFSVRRFF